MAATLYTEMIDRAKSAADMHDGFPSIVTWLYFLNAELNKLWVRLLRSGYPPTVTSVPVVATGAAAYTATEPSAVIAMHGSTVSGSTTRYYNIPIKRLWEKTTIRSGTYPFECYIDSAVATGLINISFYPNPTSGTFTLLVVPKPAKVVSGTPAAGQSSSVVLPFGWEERVVLGMAQRALAKEETVNPNIEREISALDEQIDTHVMDYILGQSNAASATGDFPTALQTNYLNWIYW